jgi:hypothetical protein
MNVSRRIIGIRAGIQPESGIVRISRPKEHFHFGRCPA